MTTRPARAAVIFVTGLVVAGTSLLLAQHEVTADDIREGERLFLASCAGCHGTEGDAVFGIDIGRNQFRRANTDEDLVRVVKEGIAGTAMPPNNFTDTQATNLVAYIRSMVSTPLAFVPGDADRGKAIFEGRGGCAACHRVNGNGSRVGPDLSDIGQLRRVGDLDKSLVDPGAEVLPANRSYRVVTRDGATVTGRLLNLDSFAVLLMDSQEHLRSFVKSNLREYGFVDQSPMPSYRDRLGAAERTDVIRYLATLKGVKAAAP